MDFSLQPRTEPGRRFVEQAEKHAADFAPRADQHDREGSFPHGNFEEMKQSGILTAPVPEEFGGWGLASAVDIAAGLNRLARADGSTAIAANMHLTFALIGAHVYRGQLEAGETEQAEVTSGLLRLIGGGSIAMANATEPGTDLRHPLTEVTKVADGWSITGHKIFGTLSEIADLMFVPARLAQPDGSYTQGAVVVFRGMPGQTIRDNWDALGMRASGSHDVVYENCVVPESLWLPGPRWGDDDELNLVIATAGNLGLVASSLGIAEAARDLVVDMAKRRTKAPSNRPIAERRGIQHLVAEIEVDLAVCRAMLDWIGRAIDDLMYGGPAADATIERLHELNKEFQAVKLVVNRRAIDAVDKAMTVSGGAGYMTAHPLSRMYRDVRAGPFMQPLSPVEAHEYIGKIALGLEPRLEV